MKHTYLLLCFFISIFQIVKIVRGENLPETSVKKGIFLVSFFWNKSSFLIFIDKQIGPEYDASKYSLLDDVTDLNDLSEEEKQEYIRIQKNFKIISKDVLEKTSPVDNLDLSSRISNSKIEKSEISLHLKAKTSILEEVKTSEKKDGVTLENTKTNSEEQKEIESTTLSIEQLSKSFLQQNVMGIEPIELESEMTEKEKRNEENLEATYVETTSLKLKKDTTYNNEKFEFENSEAQVKPNEKTEKKVFETVIGINSTNHSFGSIETETTENPQLENNPNKIESSIIAKEDSKMDTIKEQKLTPDSEIVLRMPDILKSSDSERSNEMEGEKSTTISFLNNQNFKNSFESEEYFIKDSVVEEVKVTTTVSTTHLIENDDLYNYFVKNETEMESRVNEQSENEKDLSKNMNFTNESSETLIEKPSHHSVEILNEGLNMNFFILV